MRETVREGDGRKKYIDEIAEVCRHVYAMTRAALDAGALPVVLGGDHSVAAGSVAASAGWVRQALGQPLGLIWVDAHGDMNTPETSESGNVHGMPLAALLGQEPRELAAIGGGAVGAARAHRARRHPQPRRPREGPDPRRRRPRLHDEGHRSRRHRPRGRARDRAGVGGHRRHARVVRSRRLRSVDCARASARRCAAASTTAKPTC